MVIHGLRQPGDLYRIIVKGHAVWKVISNDNVVGNAFCVFHFYGKGGLFSNLILVFVGYLVNGDRCGIDICLRIVIGMAGSVLDVHTGCAGCVIQLFGVS